MKIYTYNVENAEDFGANVIIREEETEKRQLQELINRKLQKGDLLYLPSITAFGYDFSKLPGYWNKITKQIGADLVILDMPVLDSRSTSTIDGKPLTDIAIELLLYMYETYLKFRISRTTAGIYKAMENGKKIGRPEMEKPEVYQAVYTQWKMKHISAREAARRLEVDTKTFLKWAEKEGKKESIV